MSKIISLVSGMVVVWWWCMVVVWWWCMVWYDDGVWYGMMMVYGIVMMWYGR